MNPYLISGTNVLRNLIGATTVTELEAAENDLVSARMLEFQSNPPVAQGTLRQLQQIHRQLFQDIYDWAGQIRTVDIEYAERMLKEDHLLQGLDRETFVERISVHYDNFSILHPSERVMVAHKDCLEPCCTRCRLEIELAYGLQTRKRSSVTNR
ncbi:MAG: Fic family protein [Bifidobacterium breve]|nr:Fic family protein [Bifidobacterium breve]